VPLCAKKGTLYSPKLSQQEGTVSLRILGFQTWQAIFFESDFAGMHFSLFLQPHSGKFLLSSVG